MGYSRNEEILENILGENDELPAAQSRMEALLLQILQMLAAGGTLKAVTNGNGTVTMTIERGVNNG